jgi:hypothetical protein
MKILSPEIITREEDVFITSLKSTLNSSHIGKVFKDQYNLSSIASTNYNSGDIIVYNDQIAFNLGFEVKVAFAVLIDRNGHFLGITDTDKAVAAEVEGAAYRMNLVEPEFIKKCEKEIIAAMAASLEKHALQDLFEKDFRLNIHGNLEFQKGSMVAHENSVAYRLEYETQLLFNLLIDRSGNYLGPGQPQEFVNEPEVQASAPDDYSSGYTSAGSGSNYF